LLVYYIKLMTLKIVDVLMLAFHEANWGSGIFYDVELRPYPAFGVTGSMALKKKTDVSPIVHQLGAQIPWKHNCVLLDRIKETGCRCRIPSIAA